MAASVTITGIEGIPEILPGDDLAALIVASARAQDVTLQAGDVLIVTQKVVSKSEGRFVDLREVEPSPLAVELATNWEKDARHVEVVLRESRRIVRMDHGVIICETRHGFVCANAGVDASNVPGNERVLLLPVDPDDSAARIRKGIAVATGADIAVIISDTFGRPWRTGYTEVAIGVAGMLPIIDYVGQVGRTRARAQGHLDLCRGRVGVLRRACHRQGQPGARGPDPRLPGAEGRRLCPRDGAPGRTRLVPVGPSGTWYVAPEKVSSGATGRARCRPSWWELGRAIEDGQFRPAGAEGRT